MVLTHAKTKPTKKSKTTSSGAHPEIINWPYRNNPILRLTNGRVIEGQIIEARDEYIVLREELKTDSYIEYQVQKDRIGAIEFNASNSAESRMVQRCLMNQFPKLDTYETLIRHARAFYSRSSTPDVDSFRPNVILRMWNAISHH